MTRPGGAAAARRKVPGRYERKRSPMPGRRSGRALASSALTVVLSPAQILARFGAVTEAWAPTVARLLLGLVLLWFGYHELVSPDLWTGYVPIISATSQTAQVLVLAHGWMLLVLAVALLGGVAPRLAAAVAAMLLLEIVISLSVTGGLSDLVLRDVGVLGLAIAVTGAARQRLLLRR
jgi:uncharacterized membrane protein YphA (DoxX/SURF4 family)